MKKFVLLTTLATLAFSTPARSEDCIAKLENEVGDSSFFWFPCCFAGQYTVLADPELSRTHSLLSEAQKGYGRLFDRFVEAVLSDMN